MTGVEGKRDYVRVHDEFNVRLVKRDDESRLGAMEINASKAVNVSASGLLLTLNEKLDIGSILNITFLKPNTFEFFKGLGKIVRVEKEYDGTYKVGIRFLNLTDEDMKMLDYYIQMGKENLH
jgi:c-di-GMP-binding flagellar brake protein YcgR